MEQWKDIPGYEGLYVISDSGRIKNRHGREIKHKPLTNRFPYSRVKLSKQDSTSNFLIHRLVMITFMPISNMAQMTVDHIDFNKTNNHLSNLQWLSHEANSGRKVKLLWISPNEVEIQDPITGRPRRFKAVES